MSDTSSAAATLSDCVLEATIVKRPANSNDVAGSVGRSASADSVHFVDGPSRCCVFSTASHPRLVPFSVDGRLSLTVVRGTTFGALHLRA